MTRQSLLAFVLLVAGATAQPLRAQSAASVLDAAATALGAPGVRAIHVAGFGSDYIFGQAYDGQSPWPRFNLPAYAVTIDYTLPALRDDRRRAQALNPPLGGGFQPIVGEIRQVWMLNGRDAWDVVGDAVAPAAPERDMRTAVDGRLAQIWLTPHGFLAGARAHNATAATRGDGTARRTIVSFTAPSKATFTGTFDDRNLLERVETWVANPVLGDMLYEAVFSDYRLFGSVMFPARIQQRSGGYPVLDVTITTVTPNPTASFDVPAAIRSAPAPVPPAVEAQRLADGVWLLPGDAKSVAVEFKDHVVVIDAPQTEARSTLVIAAVKKAVPGKPIRYVVNTHHHFDHSGGLRTYAAEGATVITQRDNIPFYEQAWANPRTLGPDALARSGRRATFEGVVGSRMLTDGERTLFLYHYAGNMHNAGMLMAYLPRERILVEADSFTPPASLGAPPTALANLAHWIQAVERLGLEVSQLVPIHGPVSAMRDARAIVERFGGMEVFAREP